MTIHQDSGVTQVPREIMLDNHLSFEARGILASLLVPDETYMKPTVIVEQGLATAGEMQNALDELTQAGYVEFLQDGQRLQLMEKYETPQQVVNAMLDHIREAEQYLADTFGPNNDGSTPDQIVDCYRSRYANAQGKYEVAHDAN